MLFDTSKLSPMSRGRVEKHLKGLIRYQGTVMTNQNMYSLFLAVAKCHSVNTEEIDILSYGLSTGRTETKETHFYNLVSEDGFLLEIPKMLYDVCTLSEESA